MLTDYVANTAWRMWQALDDRRQKRTLVREFADLEDRHLLDATLDDIGLSRGQVPALLRGFPRRQRLFRRMLARVGVPLSRIDDRATRNDMMWTCTTCAVDKRCRAWLDAGKTRGYEAFCPNSGALKRLAAHAAPTTPTLRA